ncbi:MAG: GreA/GreB family elongation factor [Oscillospiraceae bacterium]|nr:GreA/GreB family elongation factor [Oscillospiraceae bacterium]
MYDELTAGDIQKMREELDERRCKLRPELLEEVKRTRAFGDLSENFEYKEAKRAKNRNDSRIRYLENMIKTAKVISDASAENEVGLFDLVEILPDGAAQSKTVRIVTTLRTDPLQGIISKESPVGRAIMGRRAGERVTVVLDANRSYGLTIVSITKSSDDGSIPIGSY